MKFSALFASALFFAAASCERHDWDKTKILHESHGDHAHGDHDDHSSEDSDETGEPGDSPEE